MGPGRPRGRDRRPDGPPPWLPLAGEETVEWRGGPRLQTVIPAVVAGLAFVVVGAGLLWYSATEGVGAVLGVFGVLAALSGIATPIGALRRVRNTEYVVTDRNLYRKSGVLSRTVTTVGYETVQNVSYTQGITGTLFDHGTVAFDTAGGSGTELAFENVDDPRAVQRLVTDQRRRVVGASDGVDRWADVPGTPGQWAAVREEVVALRRAVEKRR